MSHTAGRSSRSLARGAIALVVLGTILRLLKFFERPGLWVDEAMIAINIGRRSFGELLDPLDFNQLAPVPWLWLEKLLVSLGGMHELVLRAPALVAGIAVPWLVWRAGLHLVGEWGALVATALTATGSALIFFAAETKPYGTDAALAALLLLLAGRCLTRPIGDRALHVLGMVGLAAVLFSFPAVFTLGGIGIALIARAGMARHVAAIRATVAWGSAWLLAFVLPQLLIYRQTGRSDAMQHFWYPAMAHLGEPGLPDRISSAINATLLTLVGVEIWPGTELFVAVLVLGAWAVVRKRGVVTMLVVTAPIGLLALAWVFDQIPANERLLLFVAPILALLFGAAVAEIMHRIPYRVRQIGTLPIAMIIAWLMVDGATEGLHRPKASGGRELVVAVQQDPHAPVWVGRWGMPVWLYYSTDWNAPDTARIDWYAAQSRDGSTAGAAVIFDEGPGRARRWHDRVERIAGQSGMKSVAGGRTNRGMVEAWAANEVRLIAAMADQRPWIVMIHENVQEHEAMRRSLDVAGIGVDSVVAQKRASLWRVLGPRDQEPSAASTSSTDPQR